MVDLEWAHAAAAVIGAAGGAVVTIFTAGLRLGRIEGRLKESFKTAMTDFERRITEKVEEERQTFDETLKGMRQKINDVELDTERRFLQRGEFDDFRKEYREDIRELKQLISERH